MERDIELSESEALMCPRCGSKNTKFRYFNNSNVTQPRYFCKTCKRHWTVGGNLRAVPFGGTRRVARQTKARLEDPAPIAQIYGNALGAIGPSGPSNSDIYWIGPHGTIQPFNGGDRPVMNNNLGQATWQMMTPPQDSTNNPSSSTPSTGFWNFPSNTPP